jgi:hypothetical protein
MKSHLSLYGVTIVCCFILFSCTKDAEPVSPEGSITAEQVLKKGTKWIYGNIYFDSTGAVTRTGAAYNDTITILGDTLADNTRWFISSVQYNVDIYVVQAVGYRNGEYWKFLRGKCSRFDTVSMSPLFRNGLKQGESFESVYCLTVGTGSEIRYKRTVMDTNVPVIVNSVTYDCQKIKEMKMAPDAYGNFEYQYYFYNSVYGLIRHEYYSKTKGGTVYRASESMLQGVVIIH